MWTLENKEDQAMRKRFRLRKAAYTQQKNKPLGITVQVPKESVFDRLRREGNALNDAEKQRQQEIAARRFPEF